MDNKRIMDALILSRDKVMERIYDKHQICQVMKGKSKRVV